MTDLGLDIRYGIRGLCRTPGFTLVVLMTLALGIGAATAMFSVVDSALRRSLPFNEVERLVFGRATFSGIVNPWVSFPDYMDYRDQSTTLESLTAINGSSRLVTITGAGEPEQALVTDATGNLFATLGVVPYLGRSYTLEELPEGGGGEVVISHPFWQHWFGGSPDVLGTSLSVNGNPLTVVGVLPAGFRFYSDSDLWIPPWPGNSDPNTRRFHNWLLVGRLAPNATLEEVQSEADVISARLERMYPDSNTNKALQIDDLRAAMVEEYRQSLFVLAGTIVFVLLIACGNVANLLLARGSARTSELAVRSALGATRPRLTRQLLVECLILAVAAGGIGVVMAVWLQKLILGFVAMDRLGIGKVGLSSTMLGAALALSLVTVLLFGLFPSLAVARANPAEQLRKGDRRSTSGEGTRYRNGLVVLQVALSVVLLVGSGLLFRSFARVRGIDPGFRVKNLLTATVSLPADKYHDDGLRIQFFQSLRESIEGLHGVETVGMITHLPILQPGGDVAIWAPERPPEANSVAVWAYRRCILPGYFAAMKIPLVEGRVLEASDTAGSAPVVVLSRAAADTIFPEESALGRQVAVDMGGEEPELFEVVGVVENHRISSMTGPPGPAMFFPFAQKTATTMRLAVGSTTDPTNLFRPIQERIWELDRDIVLGDARTMADGLSDSRAGTRSIAFALGVFAFVALILTALGLHGVLAFFVAQRTHEIGIRVALGADPRTVSRLVVTQGMALVGIGLVLGTAGAIGATHLVKGMLFQVSATDPLTFAGATGFFVLVALASSLLPAWRASMVDPLEALRAE